MAPGPAPPAGCLPRLILGLRPTASVESILAGRERAGSDEPGEGHGSHGERCCDRGPSHGRREPSVLVARGGRDDPDPAGERGDGDGGQLPVPVHAGVDEIGDVRCGRRRYEGMAAREERPDQRHAQGDGQQREPERPQLCEHLEVQAVRVADLVHEWAVLVPVVLVAPRAGADDWMVGVFVEGRAPEIHAVAAGEGEEALPEIGLVRLRSCGEGVPALLDDRVRAAVAREDGDRAGDDDQRQGAGKGERHGPRQGDATLGEAEGHGRQCAHACEHEEIEGQAMPLVRGGRQRRVGARECVLSGCEPDGEARRRRQDERHREQVQSPRVDGNSDDEAHSEREPRSAAEREVRRGQQDRESGSGEGADEQAAPCGEAECQRGAHGREEPERVPVADRLLEAVARDRVEHADPIGEEPSQEAVARRQEDSDQRAAEEHLHVHPADDENERGGDGDVEQVL